MAQHKTCLPLTPESINEAHSIIKPHIHRTPVLTSATLDRIASSPSRPGAPTPRFRLFFKCENYQKIGAFKARGAFHAVKHLIKELGIEEVRRRGVVTHSSGMVCLDREWSDPHSVAPLLTVLISQETMPKLWHLQLPPSPSLASSSCLQSPHRPRSQGRKNIQIISFSRGRPARNGSLKLRK